MDEAPFWRTNPGLFFLPGCLSLLIYRTRGGVRQQESSFSRPPSLTLCLWMCLLGYDPKELSDNKDRIDLWNLHFLLACLKHISRTWDYVYILSNPFIKYILHNAFPLEGSLCDLSITIPTSEEKHWICIILGTILSYNLCVASFSMKLGHMSSMTDVEELSGVFNYLGMWCLLNRDQWSRGVIKFLLYVKAY